MCHTGSPSAWHRQVTPVMPRFKTGDGFPVSNILGYKIAPATGERS